MNAVFVDTSFYAAIVNRRDAWHAPAMQSAVQITGPMVTSEFVLLEVANFCLHGRLRRLFVSLIADLRKASRVEIVPASAEGFQRGLELFAGRADKQWSLTDCISFHIMQQRGITDALTADEHFEQAGFRALLRD